ncbi:MAG: hypothetical protein ACQKBV_12905, partial [Puniceicoccales bacterium]
MAQYFNGTFPALLKRMDDHFDRARACFSQSSAPIEALILGGGYGRGEGGVYIENDQPSFYNDLDYFLFTPTPEDPELIKQVHAFEKEESQALGIDVEVTCLHPSKLQGAERSMMFHDLIMGHHMVLGTPDYLAEWKSKMDPALIAPIEATRLLWNRGSGLFYARSKLDDANAADFIFRQHMKLAISLGDALLCMAGQHDALCETRRERFSRLDVPLATEEIRDLHGIGVSFKQRPHPPPGGLDLSAQNEQFRNLWTQVFLTVEAQRLGTHFNDAAAYSRYTGRLFPDDKPARNILLALRDKVKRGHSLKPVTD